MQKILVTGGAGYIGSFMVKRLLEDGYSVVIADSLERGHEHVLNPQATFVKGDLKDKVFVDRLFAEQEFNGVIHFAGFISMGESMQNPGLYFENNTYATLNIINAMHSHNVNKIVFSSTAGVYGNPTTIPIPENHPKNPENPYGESKLMVETILSWYQKIYGISFTALRYFNAAGAALDGSMGEDHEPETHIIPNAMRAAIEGKEFKLFGDDYSTPDGTCVRDYIHVLDLAEAHVLAIKKMENQPGGYQYNVGTGKGYSNKEVVDMIKKVSGKEFPVTIESRRPGDANMLVADASRITQELGFTPKYSDLETIVKSAWEWHSR